MRAGVMAKWFDSQLTSADLRRIFEGSVYRWVCEYGKLLFYFWQLINAGAFKLLREFVDI